MSVWTKLGLNAREMRKARQEAGKFLGPDPPIWDDMGTDVQERKVESYIQYLRYNQNNTIADKLSVDKEAVFELLRTRTKTLRRK
ncbi:hypothetical protein G647_04022 [Cladophialophora carrionii CBS 160.54]|uniref:Uncharacterized protein n=2 Tax=Cladophialophora carrionii TaxID=86049 RepID=A0A1C1CVZ8_9EURO|nr:uncharacterized protein G647_04022 [Cladophialophora carrionii CBS 160.54]ETI24653.1 hypothetical protein G647_04022 [Cladophialophora carrionii CBS 160.54]OCT52636.1 hypothetical protein CLCR_11092 [Cladophialophora carrionii]